MYYMCPFFEDYLDALMGVCYDGVEGLLYLSLFSLLAACALSAMLCAIFRVWTLMGSRSEPSDPLIPLRTADNAQSVDACALSLSFCLYVLCVSVYHFHPETKSMTT